MLSVVDSSGQAALLAPTEVLAQQHYRTITKILGELAQAGTLQAGEIGTQVELLTGSLSAAEKKRDPCQISNRSNWDSNWHPRINFRWCWL